MNYQTATDAEINIAVANKQRIANQGTVENFSCDEFIFNHDCTTEVPDYCNNQAGMMPVVFENRISLTFETYTNEWWAMTNDCSGPSFKHTNPLRAAAIVYLMMEE